MFADYYPGKRVLVTGHTGFKGAWLSLWLHHLGAIVQGLALEPSSSPNLYEITCPGSFKPTADLRVDVRNLDAVKIAIDQCQPDIIFHLAAQPLVRQSYEEPLETFTINAIGTANLLEAVRNRGERCTVVIVTSDKCYENREWEFAYRENDALGGHDVYSMSKAATELIAHSWRRSFFQAPDRATKIKLATARAGNVIGGGDFAVDRIVPDCVRALSCGEPLTVRNPNATRPWQHVLECLSGYLWLGAKLGMNTTDMELETAFNFGPGPAANRAVGDLVTAFFREWPGSASALNPFVPANGPHEAGRLNLAIDKAGALLGWFPVWSFPETVSQTIAWYRRHASGESHAELTKLCLSQIHDYTAAAGGRVGWSLPV